MRSMSKRFPIREIEFINAEILSLQLAVQCVSLCQEQGYRS